MLTTEQIMHNAMFDEEIRQADEEHRVYVEDLDRKRERYTAEHPDDPYAHLMYIPIKSKRTVIGIRYVD
jgi:hypothetical protein